MGMWIILIGDEAFDFKTIKSMNFCDCIRISEYEDKQFDIYFNDGYVSFQNDYDGVIKNDYSPEELALLPYKNPHFILMRYSNIELAKHVISLKDFPKNILIDCDGVDLGLEQVFDKCRLYDTPKK